MGFFYCSDLGDSNTFSWLGSPPFFMAIQNQSQQHSGHKKKGEQFFQLSQVCHGDSSPFIFNYNYIVYENYIIIA